MRPGKGEPRTTALFVRWLRLFSTLGWVLILGKRLRLQMMISGNHLCSGACCGGGLGSLGHQRYMEVLLAADIYRTPFMYR